MRYMNPMCDGTHCHEDDGEVRKYPLLVRGEANVILCKPCVEHENRHRFITGQRLHMPEDRPQVAWSECEVYPEGNARRPSYVRPLVRAAATTAPLELAAAA